MAIILEGFERFAGLAAPITTPMDALGSQIRSNYGSVVGSASIVAGSSRGNAIRLYTPATGDGANYYMDFGVPGNPIQQTSPRGLFGMKVRFTSLGSAAGDLATIGNRPIEGGTVRVNVRPASSGLFVYPPGSGTGYAVINTIELEREYCLEILVDHGAKKFIVWVDGAVALDRNISSTATSIGRYYYIQSSSRSSVVVDDVYVTDDPAGVAIEPMGSWQIDLATPIGSTVAQFQPSPSDKQNWQVVGDLPADSATFAYSQVSGQRDVHELRDLSGVLSPIDDILAVQAQTIMSSENGTPDVTVAIGAGDAFVTQTTAVAPQGETGLVVTARTNPLTGNPWTPVELAQLRSGYLNGTSWPTP